MKINEEAIRGVNPNPYSKAFEWGTITCKPNNLYLHIFDQPYNDFKLSGLKNKIKKAVILSDKGEIDLNFEQKYNEKMDYHYLSIAIPEDFEHDKITVIKLYIEGEVKVSSQLEQEADNNIYLSSYNATINKAKENSQITLDEAGVIHNKERLEKRVKTDTHDLGFLYEYSCMAYYKLFGDEEAKKVAINAAELLITRYHKNAGIIQAWGDLNNSKDRGRMIIDANMNLPLLYWVSEVTGDDKYYYIAKIHVNNAAKYIVRPDNSTYHTYFFDPESGDALRGATAQGYSDESCWARGQAWAIYGFTLSYGHTKDEKYIKYAIKAADYFIEHLPEDKVCYWDLIFTDGNPQERDSSSAAIAACGLLELIKYMETGAKKDEYKLVATQMVESLIDGYSVKDDSADGLILHSVYNKPEGNGVDECSTWGDYYYMEALMRLKKDWVTYL